MNRVMMIAAAVCGMATSSLAVTHHVNVTGLTFSPTNLTIDQGDTVQWHWVNGFHTVTTGTFCIDDGNFAFPIDSFNPTGSHVFTSSGVVPYYCEFHCGSNMRGTITVNAGPPGIPTVSEWGMIGLGILMLTGGTLVIRRRAAMQRAAAVRA